MNDSGTMVVRYAYDAWGNIISTTGTMSGTLGRQNPFRYRSYYYESEIGYYYLQSRYYDPNTCRFISADNIEYLGADGTPLRYNLFAYCLNDPVNYTDPTGTFSEGHFLLGAFFLAIGVAAVCIGISVLSCGVATLPMMIVAAGTVASGVLTGINGIAEIGEAATGYNFVRDGVFQGNSSAYGIYAATTATLAVVGSCVCVGWSIKNAPRIEAYNNLQNYNYTKTISDSEHMNRPYANSLLTQRQVIKYGEMTKDPFGYGYIFSHNGYLTAGEEKLWRLGVNIEKHLIWHWGHGF